MVLNLLNLYSLVFSTLSKISEMSLLYYLIEESNSTGSPLTTQNADTTCPCSETVLYNNNHNFDSLDSENLLLDLNETTALVTTAISNTIENFTELVTENMNFILENFTVTLEQNFSMFTEDFENFSTKGGFTTEDFLSTEVFTNTEVYSEYFTEIDNTTNIDDNFTQIIYENFTILESNISDINISFGEYLENIFGMFNIFWKNFTEDFDLTENSTNYIYDTNSTDLTEIFDNASIFTDYSIDNTTSTEISFTFDLSSDISTSDIWTGTSETKFIENVTEPNFIEAYSTALEKEFVTKTDIATFNVLSTTSDVKEIGTNVYHNSSTDMNLIPSTFVTNYDTTENSLCKCNPQTNILPTEVSLLFLNKSIPSTVKKQLADYWKSLEYEKKSKIRSLCWETMFGQELIKLTVMDLLGTVGVAFGLDFFRGIFVRVMNNCWCWDLEKKFPQYGDFKVAENILHLVNNQGMVWMGMFFSPGLVALNVIKLYIMMYFRAWVVLTCNVPPTVIFRASRSNNFYYALLLMMLFLCVLPVSYAIVWVEPSWHCGPFSGYKKIFHIFTKTLKAHVPPAFHWVLEYIASPGIVIPLLLLLVLIIYYLTSLTGALKEANDDLKTQLKLERTEERRKMFKLAAKRRRATTLGESNDLSANTPFAKWKKLLGDLPSGKSHEDTPKQDSEENVEDQRKLSENKSKVFFSKLIKKALGKSSTSDDDQDNTDNEQHDSLPYDVNRPSPHAPANRTASNSSFDLQAFVHKTWNLRKKEKLEEQSNKEVEDSTNEDTLVKNKENTIKDEETKIVFENEKMNSLDSDASSLWSEKIPVITISKTESDEHILNNLVINGSDNDSKKNNSDQNGKQKNERNGRNNYSNVRSQGFKPKIKCALRKQSTEVDEDVIVHFSEDLEKMRHEEAMIKYYVEQKIDEDIESSSKQDLSRDEILLSEKSSSDGTEEKGETSSSMQTAFNISSDSSENSLESK